MSAEKSRTTAGAPGGTEALGEIRGHPALGGSPRPGHSDLRASRVGRSSLTVTTSSVPPIADATTGSPAAIASSTASGSPSESDGSATGRRRRAGRGEGVPAEEAHSLPDPELGHTTLQHRARGPFTGDEKERLGNLSSRREQMDVPLQVVETGDREHDGAWVAVGVAVSATTRSAPGRRHPHRSRSESPSRSCRRAKASSPSPGRRHGATPRCRRPPPAPPPTAARSARVPSEYRRTSDRLRRSREPVRRAPRRGRTSRRSASSGGRAAPGGARARSVRTRPGSARRPCPPSGTGETERQLTPSSASAERSGATPRLVAAQHDTGPPSAAVESRHEGHQDPLGPTDDRCVGVVADDRRQRALSIAAGRQRE